MSDKYPYIGDNGSGQVTVIYSKGKAFHLSGRFKGEYAENYLELEVKNITREYLTNTYGKCESQEHADFICKLAESAGFDYSDGYTINEQWFNFDDECVDFYIESIASNEKEKLIHLPLPPKDKEMPETKPVYTKEMHERGELPPVGSNVLISDKSVNLGSMDYFDCSTVEVKSLFKDKQGKDCVAFCSDGLGVGALVFGEWVRPIPTIEDELINFFERIEHIHPESRVERLLAHYNITPKDS